MIFISTRNPCPAVNTNLHHRQFSLRIGLTQRANQSVFRRATKVETPPPGAMENFDGRKNIDDADER
jgi:hypothetical protein